MIGAVEIAVVIELIGPDLPLSSAAQDSNDDAQRCANPDPDSDVMQRHTEGRADSYSQSRPYSRRHSFLSHDSYLLCL
jgi:hypothetical protein